jgi:hypothetical protein
MADMILTVRAKYESYETVPMNEVSRALSCADDRKMRALEVLLIKNTSSALRLESIRCSSCWKAIRLESLISASARLHYDD